MQSRMWSYRTVKNIALRYIAGEKKRKKKLKQVTWFLKPVESNEEKWHLPMTMWGEEVITA